MGVIIADPFVVSTSNGDLYFETEDDVIDFLFMNDGDVEVFDVTELIVIKTVEYKVVRDEDEDGNVEFSIEKEVSMKR